MTHKASPQACPERTPARYVVFEDRSAVGGEVSESSKGKTERWRGRRHCDDRLSVAREAGTNLGEKAPFLPCDAPFHAKQSLRDTAAFLVGCPVSGIRKEIHLGIKANRAVEIDPKV